jgi:hypothetical protein
VADYDLILLTMAVALVGGYAGVLYVRHRHRARDYPAERQWPGHGIDTTGISEKVRRVRQDYAEALQLRPDSYGRRAKILKVTRRVVCRLPYFRRRASLTACKGQGIEAPTVR